MHRLTSLIASHHADCLPRGSSLSDCPRGNLIILADHLKAMTSGTVQLARLFGDGRGSNARTGIEPVPVDGYSSLSVRNISLPSRSIWRTSGSVAFSP